MLHYADQQVSLSFVAVQVNLSEIFLLGTTLMSEVGVKTE